MAMGIENNSEEGIFDINITPFVDVVLVLLVIFMVTAPMMVRQALEVKLPDSQTADSLKPSTLGIAITSAGQILINGQIVADENFIPKVTSFLAKDPNLQAIIAADLDSKHVFVVKAMDLLRQAGITQFAFQVNKIE